MTNDNTTEQKHILRLLTPYFVNNIKVFFNIKRIDSKTGKNIFYKGFILDLSSSMNTLVLNDDVEGETPFLLEDILPNTIKPARQEVKE